MALRAFVLIAALVATALPAAAAAHASVLSADGKVLGSIGLLDEPVVTGAVTGLDVCFTQNTSTSPRAPVNVGNASLFRASLRAPNGDAHVAGLQVPPGKPNCLTFLDPLVLTQPGQYLVDLTGPINGTTFSVQGAKAGGPVLDQAAVAFPDDPAAAELALQARLDALEARLATLEAEPGKDREEFAAGAPAALLMVGLAALVAARRRA